MNAHPKILIASFDGSTVKAREPHDPDGNCLMPPVPETMDGIEDELDRAARRAVERISDRPAKEARFKGRES